MADHNGIYTVYQFDMSVELGKYTYKEALKLDWRHVWFDKKRKICWVSDRPSPWAQR